LAKCTNVPNHINAIVTSEKETIQTGGGVPVIFKVSNSIDTPNNFCGGIFAFTSIL
jgi:hypothetical protein